MVDVQIIVTSRGNIFGDALRGLRNRQEALAAAGAEALKGVQHNFDTQRSGAGAWAPLERYTVKDRARAGLGPTPILYRGGRYAKGQPKPARVLRSTFAILNQTDATITIGSRDERARTLNEKRDMVSLQPEDKRRVFRVLREKLTGG